MAFKNYKRQSNRYINHGAERTYDSTGRIIKPFAPKKKKAKKSGRVSYKVKSNKLNLGPLDKILQYDKPARKNSKRKTSKGLYTLNSIIDGGRYKGSLICDVFVNDKPYLMHIAKTYPGKFSPELLTILK